MSESGLLVAILSASKLIGNLSCPLRALPNNRDTTSKLHLSHGFVWKKPDTPVSLLYKTTYLVSDHGAIAIKYLVG